MRKAAAVYAATAFITVVLFPKIKSKLHGFVNGSGNNVVLLFFREFDEVYSITGNTNGKLRILFRVSLRVQKGFAIKYVYVEVVATVTNVAVQHINQIIYSVRHNIISLYFYFVWIARPKSGKQSFFLH